MIDTPSIHPHRSGAMHTSAAQPRSLKYLLYSHDSHGLGHLRRNLAIAGALLEQFPDSSVVIVTGSPCATQFPLPPNCDVVKIPAIGKNELGEYVTRSLNISLEDTLAARRELISGIYKAYNPDVILVDHQPTGLLGEMLGVLKLAREQGKFIAFGTRDIVDAPEVLDKAWSSPECRFVFEHCYDQVFIYGDRTVFDPLREYAALKRIANKVTVTGFVVEAVAHPPPKGITDGRPHVLVTFGGGDDGVHRIHTYLDALRLGPVEWTTHIVAGPLMPLRQVREYKHAIKHSELRDVVKISRFHGDIPGLMHHADAVVSMAGYNSCLEILNSGTPAILIPRENMRREQSIRAGRLAELGLAKYVPVGDAEQLRRAVETTLNSSQPANVDLDFNGLARLCDVLGQLTAPRFSDRPAENFAGTLALHA
jgi:predicted glycosyltransferase